MRSFILKIEPIKYWLSIVLLMCSCEQGLVVLAPGIEVPVVYCLLNPMDTIHQLRIERLYQGQQSAFQTGNIHDSIYFDDVSEIELEFINTYGESISSHRFTSQLLSKDDGKFNSEPFLAYQLNDSLPFITRNPDNRYWNPLEIVNIKLHISIPNIENGVEGTIVPISNPVFKYPDKYLKKIDVYQQNGLSLVWGYSARVKYTQIGMRLIYDELIEGKMHAREAIWVTDKGIIMGGTLASLDLYPEKFYRKILTVINEDHNVTARYLREIQIEIFTADKYYEFYKRRQQFEWKERLGEEMNLVNAIGLFSCVGRMQRKGLNLSYKSMDSLVSGQYTKHLKFRHWY